MSTITRVLRHTPDRLLHARRRREARTRLAARRRDSVLVICHGNICRSPFAAALLARELGVEVERPFATWGAGGRLREPVPVETFVGEVRSLVDADPLVFAEGPPTVERVAILSGGGARYLAEAAGEGYDLFLTGEAGEPTLHTARELRINFVAAGHYATERLGVQALAARLAEHFGLDWEFVELPNPV